MIYHSLLKNRITKMDSEKIGKSRFDFPRNFFFDSQHCHSKETALRFNHFLL
ncbi:MAG: hypothetical protein PVG90_08350 [Bacillota bacterium]|jgi:hypothetical protein